MAFISVYWSERLRDKRVFSDKKLLVPTFNIRRYGEDNEDWPHAVAREAMYSDYCSWYLRTVVDPLATSPMFAERSLPQPASLHQFFTAIKPWLYLVDPAKQVRAYLVPDTKTYKGEFIQSKSYRYFVRLFSLETHVAAYELDTGTRINDSMFSSKSIEKIEIEKEKYLKLLEHNRQKAWTKEGVDS